MKRDGRLAVRLDNIDAETKEPLAEAEFVMIAELRGKTVERVYGVPVENVEEIVLRDGRPGLTNWSRPKPATNCWQVSALYVLGLTEAKNND